MSDISEQYFELQEKIREVHRDSASVKIKEKELWKNNEGGENFADKFSMIINNIGAKSPAVILLEGEWGTGKTHFLKSFQIELKKQEHKAIYFDAFAEDFSSDPLLAICGQLWKELEDNSLNQEDLKKALNSFIVLGEFAFPQLSAIRKIWDIASKLPEPLEEYVNSRKNLEGLKSVLSKAAKTQSQEGKAKPLVFIIDELDRCRPTFSLELLERVKHLFQVPGIIFIIGANKKSLTESIKSEYGLQDSDYLQKFFDLELKLPNHMPPSSIACKYQSCFANYEVLEVTTLGETDTEMGKLADIINELYYPLMDIMGITLRQAQRTTQIFLHCLALPIEKPYSHKIMALVCLILLKVGRPELYVDFAKRNGTCEKIFDEIIPLFEVQHHSYSDGEIEQCRRWFIRSICYMAEGKEKNMEFDFIKNNLVNKFGTKFETNTWKWIEQLSFNRSEVVTILENLNCQNELPDFSPIAGGFSAS